jgi:DivIVA domain-containing protein
MSDVDAHRRPISTAARLNPEEISNRAFSVGRRGYSESEVRAFLRRVADDLGVLRERERQLAQQVEELETKLRNPEPPTERQLLDSLGEETARVLRSAQEASEDIRDKAAEKSTQIVHEAQESARVLREDAESFVSDRRREAEEAAAQLVQTAEARASELRVEVDEHVKALRDETDRFVSEERERATGEIGSEIESARERGREMLNEARAVRERVLSDLTKRRGQMQHQIEELRAGREQMLDAYRVVRRTLGEAADALAGTDGVDAVLAAISPGPVPVEATAPPGPVPVEATAPPGPKASPQTPIQAPAGAGSSSPDEQVEDEPAEASETRGAKDAAKASAEERPRAADVFARLRAGRSRRPDESAAQQEIEHTAATTTATATDGPGDDEDDDEAAVAIGNDEIDLTADTDDSADPDGRRLRARDDALAEPGRALLRTGKRALQDEQNDVLDALRRQKGNLNLDELLPARDAQQAMWLEVLRDPLGDAYAAGFTSSGGSAKPAHAPDELVGELAATLVDPLRERLATVDASSADAEVLTQQIGSRYREWKSQSLQPALDDALAVAYSRGVYESTPSDARLRWVPARPGQCPDCDDNALEPTPRGEPFPTGQPFPPAHPGCRCLLVAVEAGTGA